MVVSLPWIAAFLRRSALLDSLQKFRGSFFRTFILLSIEAFFLFPGCESDEKNLSELYWFEDPKAECPDLSGCFSLSHGTLGFSCHAENIHVIQEACHLKIGCTGDKSSSNGETSFTVSHTLQVSPDGKMLAEKSLMDGMLLPFDPSKSDPGCWNSRNEFEDGSEYTDYYITVCRTGNQCSGERRMEMKKIR